MTEVPLPKPTSPEFNRKTELRWKIVLPIAIAAGVFCLAACLVIGFFGGIYVNDQFGFSIQKKTVYLIIDRESNAEDSQQSITDAIEILRRRSQDLGYGNVTIRQDAANLKRIILKIPVDSDQDQYLENVLAVGLVELVDYGVVPPNIGDQARTDFNFLFEPVYDVPIRRTITTNQEITYAGLIKKDEKVSLSFSVNEHGKELLKTYSTKNTGHYLAIVLDKIVISVPRVSGPIPDGSIIVDGLEEEQAHRLAAYFRSQPLSLKLIIEPEK